MGVLLRELPYDGGERSSGSRCRLLGLDRIDNEQGYSPENCRWADKFTQTHNKTRPA